MKIASNGATLQDGAKTAIIKLGMLLHRLRYKMVFVAGSDDTLGLENLDVTRSLVLNLFKELNGLVYDMIPLLPTLARATNKEGEEDFHFKDGQYFHIAKIVKSAIELKDFFMSVLVPRPSVININELLFEFYSSKKTSFAIWKISGTNQCDGQDFGFVFT